MASDQSADNCPSPFGGRVAKVVKAVRKFVSVAEAKPEIAGEAYGWDPATVSCGNDKKLSWRCAKGHIWIARVANRCTLGRGCPYCSGRLPIPGETDLATTHPRLLPEVDGWDATTVKAGCNDKRPWICAKGHKWEATIGSRALRGSSCPYCSGRRAIEGQSSLLSINPKVASEAHGWNPDTVSAHSNRKLPWKCWKAGHIWTAVVSGRVSRNIGCPYCSGRLVLAGVNDLKTRFPIIAELADGWDPSAVSARSGKNKRWRCQHGHRWTASVNNLTRPNAGCPECWLLNKSAHFGGLAERRAVANRTTVADLYPLLAADAHGWDPARVAARSGVIREWKCKRGHVWTATANHRANGTGCPVCASKKVIRGDNDLATLHPEINKEAHGWDASKYAPWSSKKKAWKCPAHGHIYRAAIAERINGKGCPYCRGRRLLPGFNDLQTRFPGIAAQAHGWDASAILHGTWESRPWRCQEGHVWTAPVARRKTSGCPYCSTGGFDIGSPGYLYMVEDGTRRKIGIANRITTRVMTQHRKSGWTHFQRIGPLPGIVIRDLETAIKAKIKEAGIPTGECAFREIFDGWTEAWNKSDMPASVDRLPNLFEFLGVDVDTVAKKSMEFGKFVRTKPRVRVTLKTTILSLTCEKGHPYQISEAHRRQGGRCPFCLLHKLLPGFNDFATHYPDAASEADGWDPSTVLRTCRERMSWKCKAAGHAWTMEASKRAKGTGCPICHILGRSAAAQARTAARVVPGVNSLKALYPSVALEADGWEPDAFMPASNQKMPWKCLKYGHKWATSINLRTNMGTGCSVCSGKQVLAGFNDLASKFPEIAKQARGWDPSTVVAGSNKKLPWKCDQGHEWTAVVSGRTGRGTGCPKCSGRVAIPGKTSLAAKNPRLAREAHGWDPDQVTALSNQKKAWKCLLAGHTWIAVVGSRYMGRAGCPHCYREAASERAQARARAKVVVGVNDLFTTDPAVAAEADGWSPAEFTRGSGQKVPWKCLRSGHVWLAPIRNRTVLARGCPCCAGKIAVPGQTDLATLYPEVAARAHGWDPSMVLPRSNRKLEWICPVGHIYQRVVDAHSAGGVMSCPTCSGRSTKVIPTTIIDRPLVQGDLFSEVAT